MQQGAATPEELESLLEDAFVLKDRAGVTQLFDDGGVLSAASGEARGAEQIGRLASAMWEDDPCYLADPQRVVQARDIALMVGRQSLGVTRRRRDGRWLYLISLLDVTPNEGEAR